MRMRPYSRDSGTLSWKESGFFKMSGVEWPGQPKLTISGFVLHERETHISLVQATFICGFQFHVAEPNPNYYVGPPAV